LERAQLELSARGAKPPITFCELPRAGDRTPYLVGLWRWRGSRACQTELMTGCAVRQRIKEPGKIRCTRAGWFKASRVRLRGPSHTHSLTDFLNCVRRFADKTSKSRQVSQTQSKPVVERPATRSSSFRSGAMTTQPHGIWGELTDYALPPRAHRDVGRARSIIASQLRLRGLLE
jgi:hypothetical protein